MAGRGGGVRGTGPDCDPVGRSQFCNGGYSEKPAYAGLAGSNNHCPTAIRSSSYFAARNAAKSSQICCSTFASTTRLSPCCSSFSE